VTAANWLEEVRFGADGLVPVVAQERLSGDVLMLAWANREALEQTLLSGNAHYYSRSRQTLWRKGETSGHEQRVVEIRLDCDGDAVLYRVEQSGPACHNGTRTCFSKAVRRDSTPQDESILLEEEDAGGHQLSRLAALIASRARNPQPGSYTASLLEQGRGKISQKVGEEAVEVVVAANSEDDHRLASEAADLLYHLLVLLQSRGVPLGAVLKELQDREK
jgi:phosphoribosyl-AMP cyclohydrolase / phosphoribosyl-ATP pyrophosphohydrolase